MESGFPHSERIHVPGRPSSHQGEPEAELSHGPGCRPAIKETFYSPCRKPLLGLSDTEGKSGARNYQKVSHQSPVSPTVCQLSAEISG